MGDGSRRIESPFKVDDALMHSWVALGEELTSLAGIRLAFTLNEILEHKRHKAAHKLGRGLFHRHKNWKASLAANAGIAVLIVPLTLLLPRLHLQTGGPSVRQLVKGQPLKP